MPVVSQTPGVNLRAPSVAAEVVFVSTTPYLRTAYTALEVVSAPTAPYVRVTDTGSEVVHGLGPGGWTRAASLSLETVRRGSTGAVMRDTFSAVEVVWKTGALSGIRQSPWTFDFDGHTFLVLDLGTSTEVYDFTTQQWCTFETEGYGGFWNFKNGFHWRDGKKVVGGWDGTGTLLELTPGSFQDDGWRDNIYELRGVVFTDGVDDVSIVALRLVGSSGILADTAESPTLYMEFSDDNGQTWSKTYSISLTSNTRQRIEFRSLGAFSAPGRIFRIYDQGGLKYVAYMEADVG